MSELDFELIDESTDQDETTTETNEESTNSAKAKDVEGEDTLPAKSNKSNFRKMSKLNKALLAENKKLKANADKAKSKPVMVDEFEDLDDEPLFDKNEFRWFLNDNPDAKDLSSEIEETILNNPTLDFQDAYAIAKANKPKESVSTNDFNTKSVNTKVRKRLGDLTPDEALKLDGWKYLEYMRLKGKVK